MKNPKVLLLERLQKSFANKEALKSLPANKDADFFYIGSKNANWALGSSCLANPFGVSKDCSQNQSLKSYRQWLFAKVKEVDKKVVPMLRKIVLSDKPIIVCENSANAGVVISLCRWFENLFTV